MIFWWSEPTLPPTSRVNEVRIMSKQFYIISGRSVRSDKFSSAESKQLASKGELRLSDELGRPENGSKHSIRLVGNVDQLIFDSPCGYAKAVRSAADPTLLNLRKVRRFLGSCLGFGLFWCCSGCFMSDEVPPKIEEKTTSPLASGEEAKSSEVEPTGIEHVGKVEAAENVQQVDDAKNNSTDALQDANGSVIPTRPHTDTTSSTSAVPPNESKIAGDGNPTLERQAILDAARRENRIEVNSNDIADLTDEANRFTGKSVRLLGGTLGGNVELEERAGKGAYGVSYENQRGDRFMPGVSNVWIAMPNMMGKGFRSFATRDNSYQVRSIDADVVQYPSALGLRTALLVYELRITSEGAEDLVFTTSEMFVNQKDGKRLTRKHGETEFTTSIVNAEKSSAVVKTDEEIELARKAPLETAIGELADSPDTYVGKCVRLTRLTFGANVAATELDENSRKLLGGGEYVVEVTDGSNEKFRASGSVYVSLHPQIASSYSETSRGIRANAIIMERFAASGSREQSSQARALAATQFVAGGGRVDLLPESLRPHVREILALYRGTGKLFAGGRTAEQVMEAIYGTPQNDGATIIGSPVEMENVDADVIRIGNQIALRVYCMRSKDGIYEWTETAVFQRTTDDRLRRLYGTNAWTSTKPKAEGTTPKPPEPEIDLKALSISLQDFLTHEDKDFVAEGCRRIAELGEVDIDLIPLLVGHLSTIGDSKSGPAMIALVVAGREKTVALLGELARSKEPHIRERATKTLGALASFGIDVKSFETELRAMSLRDPSLGVKNAARNALSASSSSNKRSHLVLLGNGPGWTSHVVSQLLKQHGSLGSDAAVEFLKSRSPGVREGALAAIVSHGQPMLPNLKKLLEESKTQRIKETVQAAIDEISQKQK